MVDYIKNTQISIENDDSWDVFKLDKGIVWIKGYIHNYSKDKLVSDALNQNINTINSWLFKLDGHFSIIVQSKLFIYGAVDKIRSCPIIWSKKKSHILLTDKAEIIEKEFNLGPNDIEINHSLSFALSGYTSGSNTIYKNVSQINPGQFIWISNKTYKIDTYHVWSPWKSSDKYSKITKLNIVNENIIKKLILSVKGKQIVVPLSGGMDSRYVVSGLKKFNYENVICVSYGLKNNKEAIIAKNIAKDLGFKWIFIEYSSKIFKKAFYSEDYKKYTSFCDNLTSIHFAGEYIMLQSLKKNKNINKDAVFVNGQSGDFISGNHIPDELITINKGLKNIEDLIIATYIQKHYKHWASLNNDEYITNITLNLKQLINKIKTNKDYINKAHALYEYMEFMDRQSKYVINGQRNYEYFGYEWRLPLWDDDYLNFWEKASLKDKKNQSLYKRTMLHSNWGNVWQNIDINPNIISPKWIIPIRIMFKGVFLFLGRDKWQKFEKKYFDYFMTNTCCYGPWSYLEIIGDKRGHVNPIGWLIEDYLKNKNLNWKGKKSI